MAFSDSFFKRVEKKTNVDKDTILSLAAKLQGNMKDEKVLREVIGDLSRMTGKEVSKEKEQKIQRKCQWQQAWQLTHWRDIHLAKIAC